MSVLSRFFGPKYNDEKIVTQANNALEADPILKDATTVSVMCEKGDIKLAGTVHAQNEKDRIEGVVRSALKTSGLDFGQLYNEIQVA